MIKIYLASPYSHPDMAVKIKRFEAVNKKAGELMNRGYIVFSPSRWEFWQKQPTPFIEWCDEFHIYCLAGWQESKCIKAEFELAKSLGKKVVLHAV